MSNLDQAALDRIEQLIADMTIEEKAGQLTQYFYFNEIDADADASAGMAKQPAYVESELAAGRVGSLLFVTQPKEFNRLQKLAIEGNRHNIPVMFGFDVIHGFRTIFPVPIAMAASWDAEAIEAGQTVAAKEARAAGIHWAFAPMVDITWDPRWGRIIEGAGEDPVLGSMAAVAQVRGFQGDDLSGDRIIAGPKHFAGYGFPLGGRDYEESDISDNVLYNVVFPPFKAAVDAGAGNIMTAYMPLNGVPATGNTWLLRTVLREEWGFNGFLVSDANAVVSLRTHGFAKDLPDAGLKGISAGLDLEMAMIESAYKQLPEAVAQGLVSEDEIDICVRRILTAKFELGLFDNPYVDEDRAVTVLGDPAHRDAARVAAERAAVLLKNDGLLPLQLTKQPKVAVLGALAASKRDTLGPWVFDFNLDETVTILDGIKAKVGAGVEYAPGIRPVQRSFPSIFDMWPGNMPVDPENFDDDAEMQRAINLAAASDVAVVVIGEWQNQIGENASKSTLDVPGRQLELLRGVVATGTPTVAVVMSGRPLNIQWADEHVPAILQAWYPGTRGGEAVANLLFGDAVPGGKLPFTWARTEGQIPMVHSHLTSFEPHNAGRRYWDLASTPLYPFGHGLSYSTFSYSAPTLSATEIGPDDKLTVSVEVTNTGSVDADEVVQLYLHQKWGNAARPARQLKAFRRVHIAAGATEKVSFDLGRDELQYWNAISRSWLLDAADYEVGVGGDSTAELSATFTVK